MTKYFTFILFVLLTNNAFCQNGFKCYDETEHFIFFCQDVKDYREYTEEFERSYKHIKDKYWYAQIETTKIKIYIFKNRSEFLKAVCENLQSLNSVAMADPSKKIVYITSYYDSSTGRDTAEYKKVARHELMHILLWNENAWLSEGLALYVAEQYRPIINRPDSYEDVLVYIDCNITNREAYGFYYYMTRYLIEKHGLNKFLLFYKSMDWSILGYKGKNEFAKDILKAIEAN